MTTMRALYLLLLLCALSLLVCSVGGQGAAELSDGGDHASAIVTELQTQLATHKAREADLEAQIKTLQEQLSGKTSDIEALNKRVAQLEEGHKQKSEEVASLSTEKQSMEGEVRKLKAASGKQEKAAGELSAKVGDLEGQVASLSRQKSVAEGEVTSLRAAVASKDGEIKKLDAQVKKLEGSAAKDASTITSLSSRVKALEQQLLDPPLPSARQLGIKLVSSSAAGIREGSVLGKRYAQEAARVAGDWWVQAGQHAARGRKQAGVYSAQAVELTGVHYAQARSAFGAAYTQTSELLSSQYVEHVAPVVEPHLEVIRPKVADAWGQVKGAAGEAWGKVKPHAEGIWGQVKPQVLAAWGKLQPQLALACAKTLEFVTEKAGPVIKEGCAKVQAQVLAGWSVLVEKYLEVREEALKRLIEASKDKKLSEDALVVLEVSMLALVLMLTWRLGLRMAWFMLTLPFAIMWRIVAPRKGATAPVEKRSKPKKGGASERRLAKEIV